MTPEQMLVILDEYGEAAAGSDFNDGDDVDGWFGWKVDADFLTIDYWPSSGDRRGPKQTARWRLVPVGGEQP